MPKNPEPERPLTGIRVLLVEDHDDSREILQALLQYRGASVTAAASAKEGLAQLGATDVVLTDIRMPGEDGYWLLREVQQSARPVPVIAVSAYSDLEAPALAGAAFARVLRKPVNDGTLCREILAVAASPR